MIFTYRFRYHTPGNVFFFGATLLGAVFAGPDSGDPGGAEGPEGPVAPTGPAGPAGPAGPRGPSVATPDPAVLLS
jgi:hypothetical protein